MSNRKIIKALLPERQPEPVEIVVSVEHDVLTGKARQFREAYLDAHPNTDQSTSEDLDLIAAAFVTLAGYLPISTYDLIKWIATSGMYDPNAIVRFAEENLGMEGPDTPVSLSKLRGKGKGK